MSVSVESQKQACAYAAVDSLVESNTVIGLGTGSTAKYCVDRVGMKLKDGSLVNVKAIPTSIATAELAKKWEIPLMQVDDLVATGEKLAVAIDGADEISDPYWLNLVKGRGAALFREKLVESQANRLAIIADESKLTWIKTGKKGIGHDGAMPVEVAQFGCDLTKHKLETGGGDENWKEIWKPSHASFRLNADNTKLVTDNDNYIVDLFFKEPIEDVKSYGDWLKTVIGVLEHGLFINMVTDLFVGMKEDGKVKMFQKFKDTSKNAEDEYKVEMSTYHPR